MKKIIILITLVLFVFGVSAQPLTKEQKQTYNRWSISADYGMNMVSSKLSNSTGGFGSFGGDIRYNVNPKLGIGLTGGTDIIDLSTMNIDPKLKPYYDSKLNYARIDLEAYINVFNMVDVYSKRFTTLFHGGPGVSFINSNEIKTVPNLRGGFTVLYRITKRISLKADMSVTGNYGTPMDITGTPLTEQNSGLHSYIANASGGISIALGKNKRHMDNYVPEKLEVQTLQPVTYITNKIDTTINKKYISNKTVMVVDTVQFVFFENDKYVIRNSELNAIYKTYMSLMNNPEYTVTIKGLASASDDKTLPVNSDDYNMKLSKNRANALESKFLDMGISPDRITKKYFGKDKLFPKESVFDAARRVELIINTHKKN